MREDLWPCGSHAPEIASYFAGTLDEPQTVLVAELEPGKPIAVIELSMREDLLETGNCLTGYVEGLYVVSEHRAAGIARHLLRAAQSWTRNNGCSHFASDRSDRVVVDQSYYQNLAAV